MINKFSILNGAKYFSLGLFQNCLVFIPAKKCIKYFSCTICIESWKSNGMSKENRKLLLIIMYYLTNFNRHCLIKNNVSISKKVINLYISYTLGAQLRNVNTDFTLGNCLFVTVKLTKSVDLDKYKHSGYDVGLDLRSNFLLPDGSYGKNVIVFGADITSSVHIDNERKDILILGEGPTQGLDNTLLTVESTYSINFTQSGIDLS